MASVRLIWRRHRGVCAPSYLSLFLAVLVGGVAQQGCSGETPERGALKGGTGGSTASATGGASAVGLGGAASVGGTRGSPVPKTGGNGGNISAASGGSQSGESGGSPNGTGAGGGSQGGAATTAVGGATTGVSSSAPGNSCRGLAENCGPQETENCCASPLLPGGMFYRGEITDNGAPATLSPFHLDRFEVTVGRYRKFVESYDAWRQAGHPAAQEGAHPNAAGTGWNPAWNTELDVLAPNAAALKKNLACTSSQNTWTDTPGVHETRPAGCVNWYQAFAFCIWDGGYLPTEAEFNFAQTGGSERRYLPWSSPPSAQQYDRKYASYECSIAESGLESCIFKVGAHPLGDGRFGQADLGGNVWEWTLDYEVGYPTPCQDCTSMLDPEGPMTEGRIIRGGGWSNGSSGMRSGYRVGQDPQRVRGSGIGFRCAHTP